MTRRKVLIEVEVELDPVPGTFHTADSAKEQITRILNSAIPHYHPRVVNVRPSMHKPSMRKD